MPTPEDKPRVAREAKRVLHVDARTLIPQFRTRYVARDRFLTETEFSSALRRELKGAPCLSTLSKGRSPTP